MAFSRYFTLITILLFLSGCGPVYKTEYTYQPPRTDVGKMCATQCMQAKNNSQQLCEMRNQTCEMTAKQNATIQYLEYKESQRAAGKPIKKSEIDFDDSYLCDSSCDGTNDYNQCYQTCGGVVTSYQVCTAFCKQ